MADICVLILATVAIALASSRKWTVRVGKHGTAVAGAGFKLALLFPLGAAALIVAIVRLVGHFNQESCHACSRVTYDMAITPVLGWALTFIGLSGLKSISQVTRPMSRALIAIAALCGPFLLGVAVFEVVVQFRR